MDDDPDEIMAPDTRPLMSFDNFVNNRPPRGIQYSDTTSTGSATMWRYIGKVMLGSFPKMLIIFLCIVIAAYTTEITLNFQSKGSAHASRLICYENPKAEKSGHRICHSLMGVAISSIMVCMVLMILDVFIPCVDTKFRRLAYAFSLMLSFIMGIALLVTSCMMVNIYIRFCDHLHDQPHSPYDYYDYPDKCGDDESHFMILPVFGFFTMAAWGFNGLVSIIRLGAEFINNSQQQP